MMGSLDPQQPDLIDSAIKFLVGAILIIGWLFITLSLEPKPVSADELRLKLAQREASVLQK